MDTSQNPIVDSITQTIGNIDTSLQRPEFTVDRNATTENNPDPYSANMHKRNDQLKAAFHRVAIWGINIAFFIFVCVFLIRVLHLVLPGQGRLCKWLTQEDIQGIDKLFFSGTIGGLIGRYLKVVVPDK